jgi:hypothetical protein
MNHTLHEYDDNCEDCQPSIVNTKTGKAMEKTEPIMVAILDAWKNKTTLIERRATSRVWTGQSTNPIDMEIMQRVGKILQQAAQEVEDEST